jgi:predicted protein tyrosine phosphatase
MISSGDPSLSHPTILVMGYSPAAMFLRQPEGKTVRAVIAIRGAQEYCVESNVPHRLELNFDDVEVPDPTDMIQMQRAQARQRFAAANGLALNPPSMDHARAIIEFAQAIRTIDGPVLCHCGAGISRSPGAALLCLATWSEPGQEMQCVAELFRVRPSAVPHRDLVRFGDQILQRQGRLIEALSRAQQRHSDPI